MTVVATERHGQELLHPSRSHEHRGRCDQHISYKKDRVTVTTELTVFVTEKKSYWLQKVAVDHRCLSFRPREQQKSLE